MKRLLTRSSLVAAVALLAALAVTAGSAAAADEAAGAVYTLTNAANGNAVLAFDRSRDGALSPAGNFPTGGLGTGAGLGSQGALVASENGRWLYAVNAGSNEISVFAVGEDGLSLAAKVESGGVEPISLTVAHDLLYVLNAGDATHAANIVGFRIGSHGNVSALAGSSRPLSGAAVGPAQIQFSPNGRLLVVTEKGTNSIDTYVLASNGLASGPNVQPSAGATPFGFAFDKRGHLIVSDAFGGAPGASALSSYSLSAGGALGTITPLAPDGQTAACWVVTTRTAVMRTRRTRAARTSPATRSLATAPSRCSTPSPAPPEPARSTSMWPRTTATCTHSIPGRTRSAPSSSRKTGRSHRSPASRVCPPAPSVSRPASHERREGGQVFRPPDALATQSRLH